MKPLLPEILRWGTLLWLLAACECTSSLSNTDALPAPGDPAKASEAPALSWTPLPSDPREKLLAGLLRELLPNNHLRKTPLDDRLSRQAFDVYLERLDGGKIFLLKEHVIALSAYRDQVDDQLRQGDLLLARLGSGLFVQRVKVVEALVAKRLKQPFEFDKKESYQTDRDRRGYADSEQELEERWRRSLKLQVLERVARMEETEASLRDATEVPDEAKETLDKTLAEIPKSRSDKERRAREELADSYSGRFSRLRKLKPLQPANQMLNAVASVYGPHTSYLPPAEKENFDISMSGSLEGIGAVLSEDDHYIAVRELVPGGASSRQGELEAGDLIMAVAQQGQGPVDVADMPINDVVRMIRGPRGTMVTLTVRKADSRVKVISIKRDVVEIEESFARGAIVSLPGAEPLGYIQLQKFYGNLRSRRGNTPERNATADVRKLVKGLHARGVEGLVIDLRSNGGGLLGAAVDISGLFIPTGPVVQTRQSDGDRNVYNDRDPGIAFPGAVAILVNRLSASAAEILAAALQDYGRAVVIGTGPTHGKGTVQSVIELSRVAKSPDPLGVLKLTIQQFYGIDGESTQQRGVQPDILLPDPLAHIETGERYLDHAIPWDQLPPLKYTKWRGPKPDIAALSAASSRRVGSVEAFSKLEKRMAFLEQRDEATLVPLEEKAWRKRREEDRQALKETELGLDETEPFFEVELIGAGAAAKSESGVPTANTRGDSAQGGKLTAGDEPKSNARTARLKAWRASTSRDPWVAESLHILRDLLRADANGE